MSELKFTLPWPPSINSMYSQGIIGAKRNLEEPFIDVLRGLTIHPEERTVAQILETCRSSPKALRTRVKNAFGSPRASMFLSDAGKAYRELARTALIEQRVPINALTGRLGVTAVAFTPDARVRDLDNLWKSALDVLKHNQIITDDGFIDDLHIIRGPKRNGGLFAVTVSEISHAFESRQQGLDLRESLTPATAPPPF